MYPARLLASSDGLTVTSNLTIAGSVINPLLQSQLSPLATPNGVLQSNLYKRKLAAVAAAGDVAISSSSGIFSTTSTAGVAVPNLSVQLWTTGRPVIVMLIADTSLNSQLGSSQNAGAGASLAVNGTIVQMCRLGANSAASYNGPTSFIDLPPSGLQTYSIITNVVASGGTAYWYNIRMVAYEL